MNVLSRRSRTGGPGTVPNSPRPDVLPFGGWQPPLTSGDERRGRAVPPATQRVHAGQMCLSNSLNVPASLCLIIAALFAFACSDSRQLTATGGAGGKATGGSARAGGGRPARLPAARQAPTPLAARPRLWAVRLARLPAAWQAPAARRRWDCYPTPTSAAETCPADQVCDLDAPYRCSPLSLQFGHCIVTPQTCTTDFNRGRWPRCSWITRDHAATRMLPRTAVR
jgi:hypothetical protein